MLEEEEGMCIQGQGEKRVHLLPGLTRDSGQSQGGWDGDLCHSSFTKTTQDQCGIYPSPLSPGVWGREAD